MARRNYKVLSRPSALAMTQTKQTIELLKAQNPQLSFDIIALSTHGDRVENKPLVSFGGTGLFVKELEESLLEGEADFAVHSLKDMPGVQPRGLVLASFPRREDCRDVLILREGITRASLGTGSVIGTGSPRRQLQLHSLFPGVSFKDIRGNIDTRMKKLNDGQYDAIVLAAAGLNRLSVAINDNDYLSVRDCVPAVGQGALALECRADDRETQRLLQTINHWPTQVAIRAERSFMVTIGGGCKFPLCAHASLQANSIELECVIGELNRFSFVKDTMVARIEDAEALGVSMAEMLRSRCISDGIPLYQHGNGGR